MSAVADYLNKGQGRAHRRFFLGEQVFVQGKRTATQKYDGLITVQSKVPFNPITYGISRLSQLRERDFYPTPQKTMLKLFDRFEIWYT